MILFVGISAAFICTVIQCAFVSAVQMVLNKWSGLSHNDNNFIRMTAVLSAVTTFLLMGMMVQVMVWAVLFVMEGEFESLKVAAYFSMVNFTSLGYGDITLTDEGAILGPIEAANGVLMLGLSTSALFAILRRFGEDARARSADDSPPPARAATQDSASQC